MWAHIFIVCSLAWIFSANIWLSSAAPSAVSAFYAECLDKKIQFNAHIWTKSKFLGMSIGVHNIGQGKPHSRCLDPPSSPEFQYVNDPPAAPAAGCVSCLEHDEHYILTFPNGYGRLVSPLCAALLWSHISMCRQLIPTVLDCPPRPGRFWRCRGWSWVASATSPAPSRATVPTLCFTPNLSTEGRSTGSPLIFCKRRL